MSRLRNKGWVMPVSFVLALLLALIPLPELLLPVRPYWLALVLATSFEAVLILLMPVAELLNDTCIKNTPFKSCYIFHSLEFLLIHIFYYLYYTLLPKKIKEKM